MNEFLGREEEILTKWESIGFLEGLDGDIKPNMAFLYEKAANFLLENNKKFERFNVMVFPVLRRIVTGIFADENDLYFRGDISEKYAKKMNLFKSLDYIHIIKKLHSLYDGLESIIQDINEGNEIDLQAETVREFCELIIPSLCRYFNKYDVFVKSDGDVILFKK